MVVGTTEKHDRWSLSLLGLPALVVLCCGLPALVAAGSLGVIGGWFVVHGWWLAGGAVLLSAAGLAGRWWIVQRRCAVRPSRIDGGVNMR